MKYGNNKQTDSQKDFLADMAAVGHFVSTCYSAEEAIAVITEYLRLKACSFMGMLCGDKQDKSKMSLPNNSILKDGKVKGGGE